MQDLVQLLDNLPHTGLWFTLSYLIGSIPFGLVLTRMAGLGDVRKIGSGNIGATNVLRTGNKGLAAATLLLDALKGTAAVMLARHFDPVMAYPAALGAFVGHCFPLWLRFKGGKGVATFLGLVLPFSWKVAVIFAAFWLGTAFASRYSSLSAIVATLVTPIMFFVLDMPLPGLLFMILAAIVWWRHRQNISRLIDGNESKIGIKG
ncbi:MAG: glycerol-3-phosphate 1-O-acyltransferase PlsY [Rhizobiaceae bacterium]